jgi:hypothetical protein
MSKNPYYEDKEFAPTSQPEQYQGYSYDQDQYQGDGQDTIQPIHEEQLKTRSPLFRFLNKAFDNGVEARGIERVPEDERDGTHTIGLLLLWWSVNMVVSTVPIGVSSSLSTPTILLLLLPLSYTLAFPPKMFSAYHIYPHYTDSSQPSS